MQKILQPDSKGEDLLMKNFISRYEKEQSDTKSGSTKKVLSVPSYHSQDSKAVNTSIHS